jgi:hypothetical protein
MNQAPWKAIWAIPLQFNVRPSAALNAWRGCLQADLSFGGGFAILLPFYRCVSTTPEFSLHAQNDAAALVVGRSLDEEDF